MKTKFVLFDFYNVLYFPATQEFSADVVDFITSHKNSYRYGILTAVNADLTDLLKDQKLLKAFEFVKNTTELGMPKTDPGIYQAVVNGLGLKPQEILFVDDLSENLVAAKEAGLVTLRYYKTKPLAEQLRELQK